jgi:hypothetical protein
MKEVPTGIDNFKVLIENNYFYVDKTPFIAEVTKMPGKTLLFTRPRRFGKTLNMTMLRYFFDIRSAEESRSLFQGLAIEKMPAFEEQGKYPVIYLSFKDLKVDTWEACFQIIKSMLRELYVGFPELKSFLSEEDLIEYNKIIFKKDDAEYENSLKNLSSWLVQKYGKKAVILIDEYDTPLVQAYTNGYYKEAITFFRNFLSWPLKSNDNLQVGVLTGIVRIAKEGIFSGLNNLNVYTILDQPCDEYFGLTESEVVAATREYQLEDSLPEVREWYNGYRFGDEQVYNPWSILNYLATGKLKAWWLNTSSNDLINASLDISDQVIFDELTSLLDGKKLEKPLNEGMAFEDLSSPGSIWMLLYFSGYITTDGYDPAFHEYSLRIPNKEVFSFFKDVFISKFTKDNSGHMTSLAKALRDKKITGPGSFEAFLQKLILTDASWFDTAKGEIFYQGLLLGISLSFNGSYRRHSNQESGLGRADMILEPVDKNSPGYIFELKVADSPDQLDKKLDEALKQIEEKKYAAYLMKQGVQEITAIAVAFCGKELKVKAL